MKEKTIGMDSIVNRLKRNKSICAMYEQYRDGWQGGWLDLYRLIGNKYGCSPATVKRVLQSNWLIKE